MKAQRVSERSFQDVVVQMARLHGWRLAHFRPAINRSGKWSTPMQGDTGWPDLILCKPPRFLVVELKGDGGRLQPAQKVWIEALKACGLDVRVWFPSDDAEIREVLAGEQAA